MLDVVILTFKITIPSTKIDEFAFTVTPDTGVTLTELFVKLLFYARFT